MFPKASYKPSICFVYAPIYHVLLNNTEVIVGGAEIQQKILAEGLAAEGFKVSFVTERIGDKKSINLSCNLTIFPALEIDRGNKYLLKLLYIPFSLWKVLKYINADIYYQRNANYLTGIVALFCKVYRKKFVLAGANNWNFDKGNERNLNNPLDRFSARFAIRAADKIIVQNKIQLELLRRHYKRHGTIFYNIFPPKAQRKNGRLILWVGRLEKHKRPEWFLKLAKSLSMYDFVMVGGRGSDLSFKHEIEEHAFEIENLRYLGHQPFETVEDLFDQTAIFISTYNPSTEGFPNTFLQAWSRGIPIVSSMDLDALISENNLGIVAESILEMEKAVQSLMGYMNSVEYSCRIKEVFTHKFSAPNRIEEFSRILAE